MVFSVSLVMLVLYSLAFDIISASISFFMRLLAAFESLLSFLFWVHYIMRRLFFILVFSSFPFSCILAEAISLHALVNVLYLSRKCSWDIGYFNDGH